MHLNIDLVEGLLLWEYEIVPSTSELEDIRSMRA